jgi:hypothetical protein
MMPPEIPYSLNQIHMRATALTTALAFVFSVLIWIYASAELKSLTPEQDSPGIGLALILLAIATTLTIGYIIFAFSWVAKRSYTNKKYRIFIYYSNLLFVISVVSVVASVLGLTSYIGGVPSYTDLASIVELLRRLFLMSAILFLMTSIPVIVFSAIWLWIAKSYHDYYPETPSQTQRTDQ